MTLAQRSPSRASWSTVGRALPSVAPFIGLLALLIVWSGLTDGVFTVFNLNTQSTAALALALAATGQTIVVLLGGIDLSIAGVISLTTAVLATRDLGDGAGPLLMWIVILLAMGAVCGASNGVLVTLFDLPPLVVTLATWSVFSGLALLVLPTDGGTIPSGFSDAMYENRLGLATAVWIMALLVVFGVWFRRTRLGISIRAVGSDRHSAYLSGVKIKATTVAAYALSGVFGALAGIWLSSQMASGSPTVGNPYILTSLAAVVVGGTSLAGGRGGVGGSLVGAYILTIIASVVFALEISSFWTPLLVGVLLIASVLGGSLSNVLAGRSGSS